MFSGCESSAEWAEVVDVVGRFCPTSVTAGLVNVMPVKLGL